MVNWFDLAKVSSAKDLRGIKWVTLDDNLDARGHIRGVQESRRDDPNIKNLIPVNAKLLLYKLPTGHSLPLPPNVAFSHSI